MCKIFSYLAPENPSIGANSATICVSRCQTHGWDFANGYYPISEDTLCPIGRIEKAVEDGLAKIDAALSRCP